MEKQRGRKAVVIELDEEERQTLERWIRRRSTAQGLAMRSRIVLGAAEGRTNVDIAAEVGCSGVTVSKWRNRFARRRLDGLYDNPRPGPPRRIDDAKVEEVVVKTLEETPRDATHWSTRSMANAVVLCVDYKSQIQALDRTAPILPLMPGTPQRLTHDYRRYGTTNLHAALDTASGRVITSMTRRNRTHKFQAFLNLINREVPPELDVHVVLDNASPHKTEPIQRWLQRHPRFTFHHTPTYASWMNLVERWFSELTTKQIRRGTHRSVAELTDAINQWTQHWNQNPKPFIWHKTADQIFDNLTNYLQRIPDSGH